MGHKSEEGGAIKWAADMDEKIHVKDEKYITILGKEHTDEDVGYIIRIVDHATDSVSEPWCSSSLAQAKKNFKEAIKEAKLAEVV